MTKKRIGVGLVGVGNWGRYGHIPALRLLPEYEVVAVSSRSLSKAQETASAFGIEYALNSFEQLANLAAVDLVVVLPPAPEHASVVKAAISAGKDVYCEWPLTTSTCDSEELFLLANSAGVQHVVGLQRTLGASAQYLRGLLADGYVGRLRSVRMHVSMASFGPTRSAGLEWTIDKKNFSHVLSIYGGHFMNLLFHIAGQPSTLSSIVATQFPELTLSRTGQSFPNETPDCVLVIGTLSNGALFKVQIEGGKPHQSGLQIDITGTSGDLRITNTRSFGTKQDNRIEGSQGEDGEWQVLPTPERYHTIPASALDVSVQDLAQLYKAFASDRAAGTSHARSFNDAVVMHRLIDAINGASTLHRRVSIED
ncbi:Gfo/Idh/MocA family oxidoreductase [soil metagenome]